jgi:RNA polymerase sigma-70 factor (ECF subfamily)
MSRPTPRRRRTSRRLSPATDQVLSGLADLVPDLHARALRLSGDCAAANDLTQDTLERAVRFVDRYEPGSNLRAWTFQILFHVFVSQWRRGRRERRAFEQLAGDPSAWTRPAHFIAPDAGPGALLPSTRRKLEALPAVFRTAIALVDLESLSYRDAARELGVPVGTVMSRLHRGRKLLAEQMAIDRAVA